MTKKPAQNELQRIWNAMTPEQKRAYAPSLIHGTALPGNTPKAARFLLTAPEVETTAEPDTYERRDN